MCVCVSSQHAELLKSLRQVTSEAHAARRQAGVALEEGKKRDQLVLTNRQLESARHFDRVAQVRCVYVCTHVCVYMCVRAHARLRLAHANRAQQYKASC